MCELLEGSRPEFGNEWDLESYLCFVLKRVMKKGINEKDMNEN